jgi:hypothetical protein
VSETLIQPHLSQPPIDTLETRRFLQHLTEFALEEEDRLRLHFNHHAGDDSEYMLSVQALRSVVEEGSRIRAPYLFHYGQKLAELFIASQEVDVRTQDLVIDQIDHAPLIAKLAFNACLLKTAHSARVEYFRPSL